MEYKITGNNLQLVTIEFGPDEEIYAESGAMVYISGNVQFEAKARGGIMKGIGRMFSGESFFLTEFKTSGGQGLAAFGGRVPGTIIPLEVGPGKPSYLGQKDAFLVAEDGVELEIAFQKKLGAGFFGGEGFILQRYKGKGTVWIHAAGDFVEMNLTEGQVIKVDTGAAVAWEETVNYDIERIKGIKTMFFGGEGIFLTKLTGPGKVILQSMNVRELAMALRPFMPTGGRTSGGGRMFGG